jgi:hypothetical protein
LAAGADDAGASDVEPATSCESWKPWEWKLTASGDDFCFSKL